MAIIRNILVRVGADIQGYQRNMATAQHATNGWQTTMRTATANTHFSMQSIANSLTMGRLAYVALGAAAVAAAVTVSKKAISSAMDVVESESLFSVSMGSMAQSARDWSNQLQDSLGLNAYQVRENVGLFYNMTTSMGLARAQAYGVSTGITKLAYDMSSFYNQSPDAMFEKLQSGLSGEVEPLKRLGIIVNETTVQNYAYAHGIAKVGTQLTETQKVMARYGTIMEQTKNAQGDLARTINSPANQLRLLQTQLELAKINLGNAFMPIVTIVLPILTNFAKGLASVTNTFAQFMSALFGTNNAQAQNAQSAADAAAAQGKLGDAAKKAGDKAKKGVAGFDQLNLLQENLAASAGDAADGLGGSTVPTPAKDDSKSVIPQGILDAAAKARKALEPVGKAFGEVREAFGNLGKSLSENPYVQAWANNVKTTLKNVGKGSVMVLTGGLEELAGVANIASGVLSGNFEQAVKGTEQVAGGAWDILTGIMYPFFPDIAEKMKVFKKDFGEKWASLKDDVKKYGDPTKLEAMDFALYIRDGVSQKWGELKVNTVTKWGEIKMSLSEQWEAIKAITWGDVKNTVSAHWDSLKTSTGVKWDGIKVTLSEKWNQIKTEIGWEDIKKSVLSSWEDIKTKTGEIWGEIGKGIENSIKKSINRVIDTVNWLIKGMNKIQINIPDWVPEGLGGGQAFGINIKTITPLANGGLVSAPMLAKVGDNKNAYTDPEVVSPLSKLQDMIDRSVSNAIGSSNRNSAGDTTVILQLGETELGRAVIKAINSVHRQVGMTLLTI